MLIVTPPIVMLARIVGSNALHNVSTAMKIEAEQYGDAILTLRPERLVKSGPLPTIRGVPGLEPRGALWAVIDVDGVELNVINTHLGLVPREQQLQAAALMGEDWMASEAFTAPAVLLGDVAARKLPMRLVHGIAAAIFAVLGVLTLLNVGELL